jgi:manganese efflux pump family protein
VSEVALALWIATATGGAVMAIIWLIGGGPAQHREGHSRISPLRLGGHFGFAALGLLLWITYVVSDEGLPGWLALAVLPVVATLGFLMFMTWLAGRGSESRDQIAEQRFPVVIVGAHGLFAVLTVIAVVAALLGD